MSKRQAKGANRENGKAPTATTSKNVKPEAARPSSKENERSVDQSDTALTRNHSTRQSRKKAIAPRPLNSADSERSADVAESKTESEEPAGVPSRLAKRKQVPRSKSLLRSPYELRSKARVTRKRSQSEEPVPNSMEKKSRVIKWTSPILKAVTSRNRNQKQTQKQPKEQKLLEDKPKAKQQRQRRSAVSSRSRATKPVPESADAAMDAPQPEIPDTATEALQPEKTEETAVTTTEAESTKPKASTHGQRGRKRTAKAAAAIVKKAKVLLEIPKISMQEGVVLTVGQGDVGQLGLGPDVTEKLRPGTVALDDPVVAIAAGGMHTMCLTKNGEVYTFGCNDEGALGRETDGNEELESTPNKVALSEKVVRISAGDSHSCVLTESGHVFAWGNFRDSSGAMGLTSDGPRNSPLRFLEDVTIVDIASGSDHIACLSQEGRIYTFGCGEQGQLGRIPEDCEKRGGEKGIDLLLKPAPVRITKASEDDDEADVEIDKIWCATYATIARARDSGDIYCFGLNNYGQLGMTSEVRVQFSPALVKSFEGKTWQEIRGGQHHTLALDSEGLVYALGRKEYGRLGLGDDCEDKEVPTLISTLQSVKCTAISCGNVVSFAVSDSGALYSWGMGTNGQTGHGSTDDVTSPRVVESKSLRGKFVFGVCGGGQHAVVLAKPAESQEQE